MKLTDLPNWKNLTSEEKKRLKEIYGKSAEISEELISERELKKVKTDG